MTLKIKLKVTEFGGRVMLLGSPYEYGQLKKKIIQIGHPVFELHDKIDIPKLHDLENDLESDGIWRSCFARSIALVNTNKFYI